MRDIFQPNMVYKSRRVYILLFNRFVKISRQKVHARTAEISIKITGGYFLCSPCINWVAFMFQLWLQISTDVKVSMLTTMSSRYELACKGHSSAKAQDLVT